MDRGVDAAMDVGGVLDNEYRSRSFMEVFEEFIIIVVARSIVRTVIRIIVQELSPLVFFSVQAVASALKE